ncbi:uncharacterized protein MKK02DRAFT_42072 [Dioszegia hungarica]|uniref:Uncharacterized protein n=1 Tax=Dioszegia hungarica TaxID=4972 RepID=A0AA38LX03_9TREE|nr:uncharacterized protein MKK02DRAFT_42072 [Dioszegia hungarica]KAI9639030.1 hypothetical protein MKK02DRAFT_42072 [Dioszegia hungarica]
MQADAPPNVEVKLLLISRHCQGKHNAMYEEYISEGHGFSASEYKMEEQRIARHQPLFDPCLSPKGRAQATELASIIHHEMARGMPQPMHFVSPARRAVETWAAVWGGAAAGMAGENIIARSTATVIEGLRGKIHVHLCNARRPISVLRAEYPQLIIPLGTAENDPWWQPVHDCHYELSDENTILRALQARDAREEYRAGVVRQGGGGSRADYEAQQRRTNYQHHSPLLQR